MILIVGANGNMGTRYRAILRYLGQDFECVDQESVPLKILDQAEKSSGVIVATPTHTHVSFLRLLADCGKRILCEKPFSKNIAETRDIVSHLKRHGTRVSMVSQYMELADPNSLGPSGYDYFRHGQDGLIWDCIQIIGMARGEVIIQEKSPIWKCSLNGKQLSVADMDMAYVQHVNRWLSGWQQDLDLALEFHEKTHDYNSGATADGDHC